MPGADVVDQAPRPNLSLRDVRNFFVSVEAILVVAVTLGALVTIAFTHALVDFTFGGALTLLLVAGVIPI